MPAFRIAAVTAAAIALLIGASNPLHGQSFPGFRQTFGDPDDARVQAGPLALSPSIQITNFGFDSNVFNRNEADDPESDVTGTLSPRVSGWLRLPRAQVSGRSELDFVYFRELSNLRSLDAVNSVSAELRLNRLRPYIAGNLFNTRHRLNIEIDEPVRVRHRGLAVGTDLRITGKSSVNFRAQNSRVRYDDALYLESNLGQLLSRTVTGEGFTFRYEATPLTSIGLDFERQRDRFESTPERDSDRVRISPVIDFSPHALISGRARFGVHKRTFTNRALPEARGTFMLVDLRYTLAGSTRFVVRAERDLEYSYRVREEEYQLTGFTASVIQRLSDPWDLRATIARHHLTYLVTSLAAEPIPDTDAPRETVLSYGVDVGYRVGRTRLGLQVVHRHRTSTASVSREYERIRLASSLIYNFDWGLPTY